jgi:flagellar biosynthesis/type III secretory pathway protein FliH
VALIKRADAAIMARDAMVLDLSDVARVGAEAREQARADAARTIKEAEAERERLIGTAAEEGRAVGFAEGRAAGHAEGLAAGRAEAVASMGESLSKLETAWSAALVAFEQQREAMIAESRRDIVSLAALTAGVVTKRVVKIDAGVIGDQIEAAVRLVSSASSLRVAVSEADAALAREVLPAVLARLESSANADVEVDPGLSAGSCMVRTPDGGVIDATIAGQLARVIAEVMPDARGVEAIAMVDDVGGDGGDASGADAAGEGAS